MSQEKKNRLVTAITINGILLLVILVVVVVCQIAAIVHKKNEEAQLTEEIKRYEQAKEQGEGELEYLKSEQYLYDLLINKGYAPAGN